MVERLLSIALVGGEPILYILIFMSFLSIAVVIERLVFYIRNQIDLADFSSRLIDLLNTKGSKAALELAESTRGVEASVAREGLQNFDKGEKVMTELMESMALKQQLNLDRWLTILGTVGSNAPFIGLLGTVLGIIKAFHDLAFDTQGGPSVVMAGIAEALVATAVGLLVAIPAVIFFNYFKNRQKRIMGNAAQIQRVLLAFVAETNHSGAANSDKQ